MTDTHDVARAMIERRSWRILMDTPVPAADLDAIQRLADLAPSVNGGRAARVVLVHGQDEADAMTRAITGGLIGKSNLWLRSCRPPAYAVLIGDAERGVRHGPHHLYNVDVAIAGQLVCLAAAARNLGSCWMAAIDMGGVARQMGLGDHERTPAVIALGAPGIRRKGAMLATAWDRVVSRGVSSRRKAVGDICFLDRYDSGQTLPSADLAAIPADGRTLEEVTAALAPSATFAGEDPGDERLALVMEALRQAPSADNAQTWRFVVVRGPRPAPQCHLRLRRRGRARAPGRAGQLPAHHAGGARRRRGEGRCGSTGVGAAGPVSPPVSGRTSARSRARAPRRSRPSELLKKPTRAIDVRRPGSKRDVHELSSC